MTSCQECGFDWTSPMPHCVHTVEAFPARVSQMLRDIGTVDGDARLRARPADEVWSPLEYLAHTADAIDWYAGRITRILTEQRTQLDAYDWDVHTAKQDYRQRLLDDVLNDIGRICARFTAATADSARRPGNRKGSGRMGRDARPPTLPAAPHMKPTTTYATSKSA